MALFSAQAAAIVGGLPDGREPDSPERRIDENRCDSPWAGVVGIEIGAGVYSGALVTDRWVLTAAHVAAAQREHPERITVRVPCGASRIVADHVAVHPDFKGAPTGKITTDDLALVHLREAAPADVAPYALAGRVPPAGIVATLVGYGAAGDAQRSAFVPADAGIKRVGENVLDVFFPGADGKLRGFLYDFDGPDAGTNMIGRGTLGNRREAIVGPAIRAGRCSCAKAAAG